MSTTDTRQLDGEALLRIARAVERLDLSCLRGDPIRLEDLLRGVPGDERRSLLRHGLYVELKHRRDRGEWPEAGEYEERFPDDAATVRAVFAEPEASFLAAGSLPSETDASATTPVPPQDGRPTDLPEAIGRYRIVGELDSGGQAIVYRAAHPNLALDLALKIARRPMELDQGQLADEGRILAELAHPNLVRVLDLDVFEGRPFLVMEFVRGRNLRQVVEEEGRPTPRTAVAWVAAVARALGVAHRRGIVHQDIKPQNVLLDESGHPRLIDFGIARLRDAWCEAPNPTTGGTLSFMPPEQARREANRIGPRSDVFGLGAVLYFLLTGRPPFEGKDRHAVLARAGRCEFDRTALRSTGVSRGLEHICLRALAAEPADRFATADDLARSLDRFVRQPRWYVLEATTAALLLTGAGLWWLHTLPEHPLYPAPSIGPIPGISPYDVRLPEVPGVVGLDAPIAPWDLVRVLRQDQIVDLSEAVPLKTGDRLMIRCELPRGLHAGLFWFDTEGTLTELTPVAVSSRAPLDWLLYPPKGVVPLIGRPGTELVLICARRSGPVHRADVEDLLPAGHPWPSLPARAVVRLDRAEVRIEMRPERGVGEPEPSPLGEIQDRFDALHRKARDRFDFVVGVSFLHRAEP